MTDSLTGLPNRRSFTAAVDRRVSDWRENGHVCIAVFDIDRFKRVNDRYGHDAGDAVLRTFARVVRSVVRDGDSIARIGGEEFAILFPGTAVPQAMLICDRLRTEMARAVTVVNGEAIRVTISGGVSTLGRLGPDFALKAGRRRPLRGQAQRPRPDGDWPPNCAHAKLKLTLSGRLGGSGMTSCGASFPTSGAGRGGA
jgi:diguanylate cyclase (GGDEF)-like protein